MSHNTNYAGLAFKYNLEQHPEDFIITDEVITKIEQQQAARRAAHLVANPPAPVNLWEEYRQLQGKLHTLGHDAASYETYFNNIAGNVALIEKNIKAVEHDKKHAFNVGNVRGEQSYEHHLSQMKEELSDTQQELKRAKVWKEKSAKALQAFDQHERIAELQKHFDSII